MVNTLAKSSLRDRRALRYLDVLGALTTEQVWSLCFSDIATGQRKAQQRLKRLFDRGLAKRVRPSLDSPMVYWTAQRPGLMEHTVACNWVYCYLVRRCQSWEKIEGWYPEDDYKVLRCDAFAVIRNTALKTNRFLFVEVDLSENRFDKVQKYTALCQKGVDAWWVDETSVFPTVLVVTETLARLEHIRKLAKEQNPLGLRFDVKLLSDIKRGAMEWKVNP